MYRDRTENKPLINSKGGEEWNPREACRCAFAHFHTINCADYFEIMSDNVKSRENKQHILSLTSWTSNT